VTTLSSVADQDRTVVMVTHNFVIGWIVRDVMDAPWWRWIGLNQHNGAISVVQWSDARPPQLLSFNQTAHLAAR
jgi:probable phosphoglycerate mutase